MISVITRSVRVMIKTAKLTGIVLELESDICIDKIDIYLLISVFWLSIKILISPLPSWPGETKTT